MQIVNCLPAVWKTVAATPWPIMTERFGNQDGVRTQSVLKLFFVTITPYREVTQGRVSVFNVICSQYNRVELLL